jgi:predicted nuclease of predicted toxin-antitoxin system
MKIVIDMNLTPLWVDVLTKHGWQAVHWSSIGAPRAKDSEIMNWALTNGHIVFTHDLDFGAILAATQANAPSVIQVRTQVWILRKRGLWKFGQRPQFQNMQ